MFSGPKILNASVVTTKISCDLQSFGDGQSVLSRNVKMNELYGMRGSALLTHG